MTFFLILAGIVTLIILATSWYTRTPQFGGRITSELKDRYGDSPNWVDGKFVNQAETVMNIGPKTLPTILSRQFTNRKVREPQQPLPVHTFDRDKFMNASLAFVWYGHSVLLLKIGESIFLIDPMFGPDASPIAPFAAKRFSSNTLDLIETLPPLDAVLLTHDHYDHLDLASIRKLQDKCDCWYVALGTGRHLERWGLPHSQITEFDWWDDIVLQETKITFTPSRHFSGRGTSDRARCLWGGWVFDHPDHKVYWSGDGGYGSHFSEIGKKYGPFDFGFMECGQYSEFWHQIHMYPEEAVQAAIDSGVNVAVPVHWGGFNLSLHPWKEPVERFTKSAVALNQQIFTPELGQVVDTLQTTNNNWWQQYE